MRHRQPPAWSRRCFVSSRLCFFFSHPLLPLPRKACSPPFGRVSEARCSEGLGGRSCYGKFHGSFGQRSGRDLSRSSLRSGRARSRPSGHVPDLEELDDRLQSDHGLVWTLCQPDDPCHERHRDIPRAKRPRGKGARHGSFPANVSQVACIDDSRCWSV
jgi:hypothetical protein